MKKIKFTLDDKKTEVAPGTTILDAAKAEGTFLPTFCHLKELSPKAACYVCAVEVEGETDLLPSCSTVVKSGMVVHTSSERVIDARRTCIELLLSDHVGDCLGPCMTTCPAGIDIPGFISHIAAGEVQKAHALIMRNLPFPGVLGRICKRPCEEACRRQLVEEPIAICHLKRYVADAALPEAMELLPRKGPETQQEIAIVGAGPAGLAAAYFLLILGHSCTIYEALEAPGGMLRYGIPAFRLPRNVLDREISVLEMLGAKFHFGTKLGQDITLDELRKDHSAVFLALGCWQANTIGVEGESAEGITSGIDFLLQHNRDGSADLTGKNTIVIGGGDVAMDAARTAIRKGARSVRVFCLEARDAMPAGDDEIEEAIAEGVEINNEKGIKSLVLVGERIAGIELMDCLSVYDEDGTFAPRCDPASSVNHNCEVLVIAAGQEVQSESVTAAQKTSNGRLTIDAQTFRTNISKVFAGGDCVTGPSNAIGAVGAGQNAAIAIDQFVMGRNIVGTPAVYNHSMGSLEQVPKAAVARYSPAARIPMPCIDPGERSKTFDEVETGFEAEQALKEAARCMSCGCRDAHECRLRTYAAVYEVDTPRFAGEKREYRLDDSHPSVVYEAHKCIQCRACIRITEELLDIDALQIVGRGFATRMKPVAGEELALVDADGLEKIVDHCPVGALTLKTDSVATLQPVFRRPVTK